MEDSSELFVTEKNMLEYVMGIGRNLINKIFKEMGTGYEGNRIEKDGNKYEFKGNRKKSIHGLFGSIDYKRAYYVGANNTGGEAYKESLNMFHEIFRPAGKDLIYEGKNEEMVQVTGKIVARSKKPINEIPEHLVIKEKLIEEKSGIEPESLRVDYKELSSFVMVKKGDVLAKLIPKKEGVLGSTVRGEAITYKKAEIRKVKPLKNVIREGDSVVAGCDGIFKYDSPNFWVNEVLVIQKDVDYRTGHIKFPGDIVIYGEIMDGFKVNCRGTLFCKKTLDASEVVCKDDLVVDRGIIGRKKGTVKAGGRIRACEKITWNFSYQLMEQWCNSIEAKYRVFLD